MSPCKNWRLHRGVRLGIWRGSSDDKPWYRIRVGREVALATAADLPPEWRGVYVLWHRKKSQAQAAWRLRTETGSAA